MPDQVIRYWRVQPSGNTAVGNDNNTWAHGSWANGFAPAFAGPNPNTIFEREDEDLSIADLSRIGRSCGMDDRFNRGLDESIVDSNFEFQLGKQPNLKFRSAVDFGVAALPTATSDITDGHQIDISFIQSMLNGLELFGPDDRDN